MHVPPTPALTMTEARVLYDWFRGTCYPIDDYATYHDALARLEAIANPKPPTQEKTK